MLILLTPSEVRKSIANLELEKPRPLGLLTRANP